MGRKNRTLPPGPNPREDQMTEKDQEQLRRHMGGAGERSFAAGEDAELEPADPVEGERFEGHEYRMRHTPGQAEGDRETIEEEEKRH